MADLSHLPWPYVLGADVEQDSPDELRASAAVIACTPRGRRADDESFGVTTPVFEQRPLDAARMAREIAQADPRLQPTAAEVDDIAADATTATIAVNI